MFPKSHVYYTPTQNALYCTEKWDRMDGKCDVFLIILSHFQVSAWTISIWQQQDRTSYFLFNGMTVQTTWSDAAFRPTFYEGLAPQLKDKLGGQELPDTLEGLVQLSLRLDLRTSLLPPRFLVSHLQSRSRSIKGLKKIATVFVDSPCHHNRCGWPPPFHPALSLTRSLPTI